MLGGVLESMMYVMPSCENQFTYEVWWSVHMKTAWGGQTSGTAWNIIILFRQIKQSVGCQNHDSALKNTVPTL